MLLLNIKISLIFLSLYKSFQKCLMFISSWHLIIYVLSNAKNKRLLLRFKIFGRIQILLTINSVDFLTKDLQQMFYILVPIYIYIRNLYSTLYYFFPVQLFTSLLFFYFYSYFFTIQRLPTLKLALCTLKCLSLLFSFQITIFSLITS